MDNRHKMDYRGRLCPLDEHTRHPLNSTNSLTEAIILTERDVFNLI